MGALSDTIKGLIIPNQGYFTQRFAEIQQEFDRIIDFGELEVAIDALKNMEGESSTFKGFYVTFPSHWGGGTYCIFDVSFYGDYKAEIHALMSIFMWGAFIIRKYKQLPNMIGG